MANVKNFDQENQHSISGPNFKPGHEEVLRTPMKLLKDICNTGSALRTNPDINLKPDLSQSIKRTVKMSNRKTKTSRRTSEMHKIQENIKTDHLKLFKHMEFPEIEETPKEDPEPQDKLSPPEDLEFIKELNKVNIASPHFKFTHTPPEPVEIKPIEEKIGFFEVECGPPDDLPQDDWADFDLEHMLEICHI